MEQEENPLLISFVYYKGTITSTDVHANIICGFTIQCGRQIVGPGHIEEPCMTFLKKICIGSSKKKNAILDLNWVKLLLSLTRFIENIIDVYDSK